MAEKSRAIFKRQPNKGDPVAASGIAEGLQRLSRAIENLEIKGDDYIDAKIEWANGYPRITLKFKGTTT